MRIGPTRPRRAQRVAVAAAILAVAGSAGLWLSRVPLATRVIDRELARRGVTARYGIEDLGFGRQRLTDVVIGDPAAPDLTADWIETSTDLGLHGPHVAGVRAGRVRLRARLVDGRLRLGELDKLLPTGSGGPFTLPALDAEVADARVRLETPAGPVLLRVSGKGRLDDGFRGTVAAAAPRLTQGECVATALSATLAIAIHRAAPAISGPVAAAAVTCPGTRVSGARAQVTASLGPALDRWTGRATATLDSVTQGTTRLAQVRATVGAVGTAASSEGPVELRVARFDSPVARGGATALTGSWRWRDGRATLAGGVQAAHVVLPPALRARIAGWGTAAAGTPVAPLARAIGRDAARAAGDMAVAADVAVATGQPTLLRIGRAEVQTASGAQAVLHDGAGVVLGHPQGVQIDGRLTLGGGGLPGVDLTLAQAAPGAAIRGVARVDRYARDGAALALSPVRFSTDRGATRIVTQATLSGPLADGRVEQASLPIDARWTRDGALLVDPACAPLSFARLAVSSLTLGRSRIALCPVDGALLRVGPGGVAGGARVADVRLDGAIGGTPLALRIGGGVLRADRLSFALRQVAAEIGAPGRVTRIAAATLDGRVAAGRVGGAFAGADGQIANLPLSMSAGAGDWALAGGKLGITGALRVADAAAVPRFQPLEARSVALGLAGGEIGVAGTLYEPTRGVKVADVAIGHRLGPGTGHARLSVAGITFGDGFQPELLTRTTFGVIADVHGTVSGTGDIDWSPAGVTSSGTFMTAGTDLAAAFGPVEGIAGTIRFTDLLALQSAPAQVATIRSINPGVPVTDGRIVYQTLPGTRVRVEGGQWPFAGGTLTLDPTLLDFSAAAARRMTFRIAGMDAGRFLQQFDFKNLDASGTFDGVLPMIFDADGGRIAGGRLTARDGGGTIAYLGELSEKNLGLWGNFAFQALRSLNYRNLEVGMDGPLAGELVTSVRFTGIRQGRGAKSNFLIRRLTRLPIVFSINIRAPFRGLIDSAASFYDPQRLVARNLQPLLDEQNRRTAAPADGAVQPPASETIP